MWRGISHKRLRVFVKFVEGLASLSKCTDKKVAAIVINMTGTQVYSIGVNGGPAGGQDCLCELGGKYTCAHAEANALVKCTTDRNDKAMICSLSPCITCATLIINSGIKRVYYIEEYKDRTGLDMMIAAGIKVHRILSDEEYAERVAMAKEADKCK